MLKPQPLYKALLSLVLTLMVAGPAAALDTDIYQSNVKQNCYILLDASGSMGFGVYESNIDYGAMFDSLFTLNDSCSTCYGDYIYDTVNNSSVFYQNHHDRNRIFLVVGKIGIESRTDEVGNTFLYSGDAADPDYLWYTSDMEDTYTDIDSDGNLVPADPMPEGKSQRLTVDDEGHILFDGNRLPQSQDIEYRHQQLLYGGGVIEDGFGDLINAPGYYFSGFTYDFSTHGPKEASGGEDYAYFFITGNWMNMQQMYNLTYTTNNPDPQGASTGDSAWQFETFDFTAVGDGWPKIDYALEYPADSVYYAADIEAEESITHPGAEKIRVHFDLAQFDINATGANSNKMDWVVIQTGDGSEVARYNNDNLPEDGWSADIDGNTARILLVSDSDSTTLGTGYVIDQYAYYDGEYKMSNRLEIATSSILNTIEHFRGQINWGTFTFPTANGADGATSQQVINPNLTDDENRENIASDFKNVTPGGGTPIGEALQEVFEVGYYQHRNAIDNLVCRRNYAIVLSDGFPSLDDNWELISDVRSDPHLPFEDWDGDGFTADPYQYPDPPKNYYDDVAHWMYTHSWLDKTEVSDPANSYVNVSSHQISFGFQNPLMEDAADEAGGMYITAYNEGQLNAAFYAIGLAIADAVSFTAPVVSVDAANKIQNGDDLYMGQFIPMDSGYWPGNLKKYKLGDGSTLRPESWQIYDAGTTVGENLATDDDGNFLDPEQLEGFWHNSSSTDFGGLPIHHDGAGEVLTQLVNDNFNTGNYYGRNIVFNSGGTLVDFASSVSTTDLDVVDTTTAQKIINWIYGYTFDANADGTPVALRDWALGAIIHSRPTVIDYYSNDLSDVTKRLIAVGADDGMLHVFYDDMSSDGATTGRLNDDGKEVFAFIPTTILPELKRMETESHVPFVDGTLKLYRENGQPKYLFFGLRRGGRSYIRIDVSNDNPSLWSVDEITTTEVPELGESWSDIEFAKIRTGDATFKDVVIFSGGYDNEEDNYPEPFNDLDNNGTPYADNGQIDRTEWVKTDATQDVNGDDLYTLANLDGNSHGRGVFILDIDTLDTVFKVTYGDSNLPSTPGAFSEETAQTRSDMKFCFPASPSVVTLSEIYTYTDAGGNISADRENSILKAIYTPDIYGNMFRITYAYDTATATGKWQVVKVFSANPASTRESGVTTSGANDNNDIGRKVFYGPAVSWNGAGRYFDPSNYYYPNTTFSGHGNIASIFFGTGDREHPTYQLIRNRVYAIYDDTPVTASTGIAVNSAPYTEDDLLNITCDELGKNTTQVAVDTSTYKTSLQTYLVDDVLNTGYSDPMELAGGGENDAKGWYIILEEQGDSSYCDHCDYAAVIDDTEGGRDYHVGEKILSKFTLYAGNLYFTSYQPAYDDPCVPEGNAFTYALNYLNGAAAINLNAANDLGTDESDIQTDVSDRYGKYSGVKGIPSSYEVVIRNGEAGAMASLGGAIIGPDPEDPENPYEIDGPASGIDLYYWIEQ